METIKSSSLLPIGVNYMKEIKIATEMLWAKNKYDIMARGYENYSAIKHMFKQSNSVPDYSTIYYEIKMMRELPYKTKAVVNTLEHIWGYFKRKATHEEKQQFFFHLEKIQQLPTQSFIHIPTEIDQLITFFTELVQKYDEPYLRIATILFPQLVWNEVTRKKTTFVITNEFYH